MLGNTLLEWRTPNVPLGLQDGEVHLWRACLSGNEATLPVLQEMLAPDERVKASRFRLERDQSRYVFGHGVLRTILARYLGSLPEPAFRYGPAGKPVLTSGALRFNMSHADDLVICAISRVSDVGVDLERVCSGVVALMGWLCSPPARRMLDALPQPARRRAFYRGWTRMEAHAKARGEGLALEQATFERFLDLNPPTVPARAVDGVSDDGWWLHDFAPRPGYVAAVATHGGKPRMHSWAWQLHYAEM